MTAGAPGAVEPRPPTCRLRGADDDGQRFADEAPHPSSSPQGDDDEDDEELEGDGARAGGRIPTGSLLVPSMAVASGSAGTNHVRFSWWPSMRSASAAFPDSSIRSLVTRSASEKARTVRSGPRTIAYAPSDPSSG
ncbi:hypothetical protein GCM10025865_22010 [Paraoerskovia sediminicola]|uniref:Uncharacterized protein n=1 Tax=Paraoerskovia sediminicola TaxID=1138587 RepID=A0ABM8G4B5_9CELL|nr:hypothetical protein GCM10025865_22010 [Paraoerskovia sediminicola]